MKIDWKEDAKNLTKQNPRVQDDIEDAAIRRLAVDDATSDSYGLATRRNDDPDPNPEVTDGGEDRGEHHHDEQEAAP